MVMSGDITRNSIYTCIARNLAFTSSYSSSAAQLAMQHLPI